VMRRQRSASSRKSLGSLRLCLMLNDDHACLESLKGERGACRGSR
jgi:hypothetical protein